MEIPERLFKNNVLSSKYNGTADYAIVITRWVYLFVIMWRIVLLRPTSYSVFRNTFIMYA